MGELLLQQPGLWALPGRVSMAVLGLFSIASSLLAFFLFSAFAPGAAWISLALGLCSTSSGTWGLSRLTTPLALGLQPGLKAAAVFPAPSGKGLGSRRPPDPGFTSCRVLFCAWLATFSSSVPGSGHSSSD